MNTTWCDRKGFNPPSFTHLAQQPLLSPPFLLLPLLSLVGKVQVSDPKYGAGVFCFNMEKAQNNSPRADNLGWGKDLFIDRIKSELKQQQKNTSLPLSPLIFLSESLWRRWDHRVKASALSCAEETSSSPRASHLPQVVMTHVSWGGTRASSVNLPVLQSDQSHSVDGILLASVMARCT